MKPGSASLPFFGVVPAVVDEKGESRACWPQWTWSCFFFKRRTRVELPGVPSAKLLLVLRGLDGDDIMEAERKGARESLVVFDLYIFLSSLKYIIGCLSTTSEGTELEGECEGLLVMKQPWPSIMRTVAGDHARFELTYFSHFKVRQGKALPESFLPLCHVVLSPTE